MNNRLFLSFLLSLLVFFPQAVSAQDPSPQRPVYIVQAGDTFYSIALQFNLTVDELVQANQVTDPDTLGIGDALNIPGLEGVAGILTSQTIGIGDSLAKISTRFQVAKDLLTRINHITSPAEIYAGVHLIVPQSDGAKPLNHQTLIEPGVSVLEAAVLSGQNPWTLVQENHLHGLWDALPGDILYSSAEGEEVSAVLLHPSITSIELSPLPIYQGSTGIVRIITQGATNASGSLAGYDLHFQPEGENSYVALQGVHAMADPGLVPLSLTVEFQDGNSYHLEQMVVLEKNLNFIGNRGDEPERLTVDPEGLNPELTEPENQQLRELVATVSPQRMWEGPFAVPGYNRQWLTSRFGTRRIYNGSPNLAFHTGIDFEGGTGLPVKAAAHGSVVFAGLLTVRGNTTVLDHGWGVYTVYMHQSEIKVSVGDKVEPGQEIGLVGATGLRVTGAHLHWEVWVNDVQVDPLDWLDNSYP
jgi:murein DD-endopeptidase MepM/ murein hydrolase activator NlpD